jgi:hypothetical protein
MSQASIIRAVDAKFVTLPGIDLNNVDFPNAGYVPQAELPYMAVSWPSLTSVPLGPGSDTVTEWRGVYQVRCNWPAGTGINDAATQADAVMALFPRGLSLLTDDNWLIRFESANPMPPIVDGAWVYGIARMPWFAHQFPSS